MNRLLTFAMLAISLFLSSCGPKVKLDFTPPQLYHKDLAEIVADGKLTALTGSNSTSYFIYKGYPMGYEYELLSMLANQLGVELEIKLVHNMDSIWTMLQNGEGDIIAHNLTVTNERKQMVAFTDYFMTTRQVLIQRLPPDFRWMSKADKEKAIVDNVVELDGDTIYVREGSSYYERLLHLGQEIGGNLTVISMPGDVSTEDLIGMVASGEIPLTVADKEVANVNSTVYKNLYISTEISLDQPIAWALRKNSPALLDTINSWIMDFRDSRDYNMLYAKYFSPAHTKARFTSEYHSGFGDAISPYDELIKQYAEIIGWDWRLLASLVYQESNFNAGIVGWSGASGLMQLMPVTGANFGASDLLDPAQNLMAGTTYIQYLDDYWVEEGITDSLERINFILASYNSGPAHIVDARALAEKYDKNPDQWFANVDSFILLKAKSKYYLDPVVKYGYMRGTETFEFVHEVLQRYEHYRNLYN